MTRRNFHEELETMELRLLELGELLVVLLERVQRAAQGPEHESSLLLERRLQQVELVLEGCSHPNRPVT